jgi:hypothetical protein
MMNIFSTFQDILFYHNTKRCSSYERRLISGMTPTSDGRVQFKSLVQYDL